ncbi:MAG: Slp family lipoprotein [Leptospirales bacterium]
MGIPKIRERNVMVSESVCRVRYRGFLLVFFIFIGVWSLPVLGGCALLNPPTFTQDDLQGVHNDADFRMVEKHWKRYVGEKVMIGGRVRSVDNRSDRAYIQINPTPLDEYFRPTQLEAGRGAMMLVVNGPVDPSRLLRGRRITVIGTVRRMRYPVELDSGGYLRLVTVDVVTLHTWLPRTQLITPPSGPITAPTQGGPYVPAGGNY